jgi:hypothetical protein
MLRSLRLARLAPAPRRWLTSVYPNRVATPAGQSTTSRAPSNNNSMSVTVEEAKSLICELCHQFYDQGWVGGTGGGISVKAGDSIVMAPSGVQKERMQPDDMFVLDAKGEVVHTPAAKPPPSRPPKLSECSPLFMAVSRWVARRPRLQASPGHRSRSGAARARRWCTSLCCCTGVASAIAVMMHRVLDGLLHCMRMACMQRNRCWQGPQRHTRDAHRWQPPPRPTAAAPSCVPRQRACGHPRVRRLPLVSAARRAHANAP